MVVLQKIIGLTCIIGLMGLSSCDPTSPDKGCPFFDLVPGSPYEDPVWHPSGAFIGFNHRPIKEIDYIYGIDCPHQANYTYEEDSIGFWLIDADGTNQRRVLPYFLNSPAWSRDGNWIAFMNYASIYKMPFDGENFDTTNVIQLTTEGRNFFPAWSPGDFMIAYDNSDCGSAVSPIPSNSCGSLVMNSDGSNKRFIAQTFRNPYWANDTSFVYSSNYKFDVQTGNGAPFFDLGENHIAPSYPARFNNAATIMAFIGHFTNTPQRYSKLFSVTANGLDLKLITDTNILAFSWAPDGRIVYLNFDYTRIDREKGTLWVMDADGTHPWQLTKNNLN